MEKLRYSLFVLLLCISACFDGADSSIDLREREEIMMEKCMKFGGSSNAYKDLINSAEKMKACVEQYVNIDELRSALTSTSVRPVFKYFCGKVPVMRKPCLDPFLDAFKNCLSSDESLTVDITMKSLDNVMDFACHHDGERIVSFISEYKKCNTASDSTLNLDQCIDILSESSVLGNGSVFSWGELDSLTGSLKLKDEVCATMNAADGCMVKEMRKCGSHMLLELLEGAISAARSPMPCSHVTGANNAGISSPSMTALSLFVLLLAFW